MKTWCKMYAQPSSLYISRTLLLKYTLFSLTMNVEKQVINIDLRSKLKIFIIKLVFRDFPSVKFPLKLLLILKNPHTISLPTIQNVLP